MFVWELSFQQVPYDQKFDGDSVKISQHVRSGKREDITFNHMNNIQKCFKSIIVKGKMNEHLFAWI